jgi:rhamnosyltransferase
MSDVTMSVRIACIIPTYNGGKHLSRLIDSLKFQTASFDTYVVDSSSIDGTAEIVRESGTSLFSINAAEFNHGGTRQLMIDRNPNYDIYVFMTQDAYLTDEHAIANIVAPFSDKNVGAVCGRQLPHFDATPIAKHARAFNYPENHSVKSMIDIPTLGIKTAFMSNSFAAYRKEALLSIEGFPRHVIFAEDMFVSGRMLMAGWKVVYAGNAQCRHSHNYSVTEEFSRYFDMGVFHARESWLQKNFGGAGGEGFRYVKSELQYLGINYLHLWPSAMLRNLAKLIGYKIGLREKCLSNSFKRKLGMYKRYWDGPFA